MARHGWNVSGKRDFYSVDPRKLKIDPSYNVRDLTTSEAIEKLAGLKASIVANGVRTPLEVRLNGDDIYIVAGHRRHAAVMAAIDEGHEINAVPVIPEPKGINHEERALNLIVSNSGEPLAPLEIAKVVLRLRDFGWEPAQIATRCGWASIQQVGNYLELLGAEPEVREMVRQNEVSATIAIAVVRKNGKSAGEVLRKARAAAKPDKSGKKRVTSKSLRASNGEKVIKPGQIQVLITVLHKIAGNTDEKKSCKAALDVIARLGI